METATEDKDKDREMLRREGEWELWRERYIAANNGLYTSMQAIRCRRCGRIVESGEAIEMGIAWKKRNKVVKHEKCGGDA